MSGAYALQGETKHAESTEAHTGNSSKEAKRSWWSNLPFWQEESVVEAAEAEAKRKAPFLFCMKLHLDCLHVELPALQPPALLTRGEAMWRLQRPWQNVDSTSLWLSLLLLHASPQPLLSRSK